MHRRSKSVIGLEVRTSVSISPETGAAEPGALFTYEAIPRPTFLAHEIVEDCYTSAKDPFPKKTHKFKRAADSEDVLLKPAWERPLDVAIGGLEIIEALGIGGMGVRGFGRMKLHEIPAEAKK